jgi:Ca2+-transporting ATPase
LVLLDDNFASIVSAVAAGRKIFLDIQRAFLYLIAFHIPIIGLTLVPPILGLPLLLLPLHLVWLELIVHPVSALLFQGDPPPDDLMRRPPRDPGAPMLAPRAVILSALSGSLLTAVVLLVYATQAGQGSARARGMALATLILGYRLLVLAERATSRHMANSLFPRSLRFWAVWTTAAISLPILVYVPALGSLMSVAPLKPLDWLVPSIAAVVAVGWRLLLYLRPCRT